jgi:hypothetical protein
MLYFEAVFSRAQPCLVFLPEERDSRMSRQRSRCLVWSTIAVVGAGLVLVAAERNTAPANGSAFTASTGLDPNSCKPSPPVLVTLVAGRDPGSWHVRLEALERVSAARLSLGARGPEGDVEARVAWRGALDQGQVQELDVRYRPPAGALEVWAEAASEEASAGLRRGRAAVLVTDAKSLRLAAEADAAHVLVDPESGQKVAEYRVAPGAGR